jgi:hypothetical protein
LAGCLTASVEHTKRLSPTRLREFERMRAKQRAGIVHNRPVSCGFIGYRDRS